jgi:hypothetical protein
VFSIEVRFEALKLRERWTISSSEASVTTLIFTVTCDGRPAAMVRAADKHAAIAVVLDFAEQRNLLGLVGGPRQFLAREPNEGEMAEWSRHHVDQLIFEEPIAA